MVEGTAAAQQVLAWAVLPQWVAVGGVGGASMEEEAAGSMAVVAVVVVGAMPLWQHTHRALYLFLSLVLVLLRSYLALCAHWAPPWHHARLALLIHFQIQWVACSHRAPLVARDSTALQALPYVALSERIRLVVKAIASIASLALT